MSDPFAINEHPYLSGCARTSHRSVMAYSAFSTFIGTRNGPVGLAFSWYLRRAAKLSNAELTLLTELQSGGTSSRHFLPSCRAARLWLPRPVVKGQCFTVVLA
ncbi:hypothetical protein AAC387_Pa08g2654 [Persea americana]